MAFGWPVFWPPNKVGFLCGDDDTQLEKSNAAGPEWTQSCAFSLSPDVETILQFFTFLGRLASLILSLGRCGYGLQNVIYIFLAKFMITL